MDVHIDANSLKALDIILFLGRNITTIENIPMYANNIPSRFSL